MKRHIWVQRCFQHCHILPLSVQALSVDAEQWISISHSQAWNKQLEAWFSWEQPSFGGFQSMGVPLNHPFLFGFFHETNHPAIGVPAWLRNSNGIPGPQLMAWSIGLPELIYPTWNMGFSMVFCMFEKRLPFIVGNTSGILLWYFSRGKRWLLQKVRSGVEMSASQTYTMEL